MDRRKRWALLLALFAAVAGVSVGPELVIGVVDVACQVAGCE